MTEIRLWNTATKRKDSLPPPPYGPRMYVCGPTVYERAHLGNARPAVVFDTLFRLLRHVYGSEAVTYVRNFTDVDDKINARAAETGRDIADITAETTRWYLDDMAALGVMEPTHMPRATGYIPQMVAMIEGLVERGHAYAAEGHVLFRVRSYAGYGSFSGRSVDDMIAGARVDVAPYKEDPMDFVLWKPSTPDLPGWDSPWGRGRPGWHIECSAMAADLLGESFDIHGGGTDLIFPHHENEIAQSRCMGHPFARIWMHNEMLLVEGRKMSKSLGNFFTVRDLLDRGVPGEVIRFVMLQTHYRSPMDWTSEKATDAEATLKRWRRATEGLEPKSPPSEMVLATLGDDLNAPALLKELHVLYAMGEYAMLLGAAHLLGLLFPELRDWHWAKFEQDQGDLFVVGDSASQRHVVEAFRLGDQWKALRDEKRYSDADALRAAASEAGIELRSTPRQIIIDMDRPVDPAKLGSLL